MPKPTAPTEKKPRVVSPEKAALREKYKLELQALDAAKKSAAILQRITDHFLPQLTHGDRLILIKAIENTAVQK